MSSIIIKLLKSKLGLSFIVSVILGGTIWVKNVQLKSCKADIVTLQAQQLELITSINIQNYKIEDLKKEAEMIAKKAELAALRRIKQADKLRAELATMKAGPEGMNKWIEKLFK